MIFKNIYEHIKSINMKVIFKELNKEESLDDFLKRCKDHIQISKEELLEKGEFSFCDDEFILSIDDENGNMICDIYWDNEETVHDYVNELYPDEFYLLSHKRYHGTDWENDEEYILDSSEIRGKDMNGIDEIAFKWKRIYNESGYLDEDKIVYKLISLSDPSEELEWEDDWNYNSHELIKVSNYKPGGMEKYMKKNPNYNEKYHR